MEPVIWKSGDVNLMGVIHKLGNTFIAGIPCPSLHIGDFGFGGREESRGAGPCGCTYGP